MAYKAVINAVTAPNAGTFIGYDVSFVDTSIPLVIEEYQDALYFGSQVTAYTPDEIIAGVQAGILAHSVSMGYGMVATDIFWSAPVPFTQAQIGVLKNIASKSFSSVSRSLNSAFQISTTRDTFVSYGVDIAASLSLSGGATGTVTLQYADNSGMSTNLVTVNTAVNGNTGTLTIGLALTQTATATVSGVIPAGKYVRIVTTNTTGTPTFTYRTGQEVLS